MLLWNLETDKRIRDHFIFELFRLRVKVVIVTVVEDMQHVVGCWHKLARLLIDQGQQLKRFDVERKVLQVIWQPDNADDQVD